MVCVTLAALAAMVAESFRGKGEDMPIGGLGVIGLGFALVGVRAAVGPEPVQLRHDSGRQLRPVRQHHHLHRRAADDRDLRSGHPPRRPAGRRVLRAAAVLDCRHDHDGGRLRPADDLPRARDSVDLDLRAHRACGATRRPAIEAAFKYFLLGAFSSAFFLYGVALTYALTGSTRLDRIGTWMAAEGMNVSPMMLFALGLLLIGFAFKVSAVPFHMWTPDAYEGAPTRGHRRSCRPA